MSNEAEPVILGQGRLSWPSRERVSDRYGAVMLMHDGDSFAGCGSYVALDGSLTGRRGTLIAEVLETRQSTHIGDLFRSLSPATPEVGEHITLGGPGELFVEATDWGADLVGLLPDDGRNDDWLNPKMLYRAHEQTVRLTFVPTADDDAPTDG